MLYDGQAMLLLGTINASAWRSQIQAGTYVLLAIGLNVVVGFAGLLDLGYAAFFAIGAYTYALFSSSQLEPPLLCTRAFTLGPWWFFVLMIFVVWWWRPARARCLASPLCGCAVTTSRS